MADFVGAVDQGTTSTRFMIFDHAGNAHAKSQLEHEQLLPQPGWVEHDPVEIWQDTRTGRIATALGAAHAAGLASGFCKDTDELRANGNEDERWTPTWSEDRRRTGYASWWKAVERTLDRVDVR